MTSRRILRLHDYDKPRYRFIMHAWAVLYHKLYSAHFAAAPRLKVFLIARQRTRASDGSGREILTVSEPFIDPDIDNYRSGHKSSYLSLLENLRMK